MIRTNIKTQKTNEIQKQSIQKQAAAFSTDIPILQSRFNLILLFHSK